MIKIRYATVLMCLVAVSAFIISGCTPGNRMMRDRQVSGSTGDESFENNEFNFTENQSYGSPRDEQNRKTVAASSQNPDKTEQYVQRYPQTLNKDKTPVVAASAVNYRTEKNEPDFSEKGLASWYGREFHGKITASGEKFNMYDCTAAHKTLPFGSIVEVKNLENGKVVRVKINDRGPYRGSRIIDLSYSAAKEVGIISAGTSMVGINVLKKGNGVNLKRDSSQDAEIKPVVDDLTERNKPVRIITGNYFLQAGAFYSKLNAEKFKSKLEGLVENRVEIVSEGDFYKVRIKGLASRAEADRFKRILQDENINSFVINGCE